jgi:hypothetical protein
LKAPENVFPPSLGTMFICTPPVLRSAEIPAGFDADFLNGQLIKDEIAPPWRRCTIPSTMGALSSKRPPCAEKAFARSSSPPTLCQHRLPMTAPG